MGTRQRQEGAKKYHVLVKSLKIPIAKGTSFSFANVLQPSSALLLPPPLILKRPLLLAAAAVSLECERGREEER